MTKTVTANGFSLDTGGQRVVVDPQRPQDDVLLQAGEPEQLRVALARLGRDGLLPYALVGTLDDASRGDRERALLVLEVVGMAKDLEVAARMIAKGAFVCPDALEPWFINASLSDEDVAETLEKFDESLSEELAGRG